MTGTSPFLVISIFVRLLKYTLSASMSLRLRRNSIFASIMQNSTSLISVCIITDLTDDNILILNYTVTLPSEDLSNAVSTKYQKAQNQEILAVEYLAAPISTMIPQNYLKSYYNEPPEVKTSELSLIPSSFSSEAVAVSGNNQYK